MGGFLGIGGASWKTDRSQVLKGYGQLNNLFNFGMGTGQDLTGQGKATTGAGLNVLSQMALPGASAAQGYYQNLMSGSRPAVMASMAPETNAINAQDAATRRQQASMGTARGGGTAAVNQQQESNRLAQENNMMFGARSQAAQGVLGAAGTEAGIGGTVAGTGINQLDAASRMLGLGGQAAIANTELASQNRVSDYKINQDMVGKVAQTALNILSI